jgi:hypothetical protein
MALRATRGHQIAGRGNRRQRREPQSEKSTQPRSRSPFASFKPERTFVRPRYLRSSINCHRDTRSTCDACTRPKATFLFLTSDAAAEQQPPPHTHAHSNWSLGRLRVDKRRGARPPNMTGHLCHDPRNGQNAAVIIIIGVGRKSRSAPSAWKWAESKRGKQTQPANSRERRRGTPRGVLFLALCPRRIPAELREDLEASMSAATLTSRYFLGFFVRPFPFPALAFSFSHVEARQTNRTIGKLVLASSLSFCRCKRIGHALYDLRSTLQSGLELIESARLSCLLSFSFSLSLPEIDIGGTRPVGN